jgi:FkbM family methyltransferase
MKVLVLNEHRAVVFGRDGVFMVNRNDFYIGKALETYGEYSQAESELLQSLVSEGDLVIEVGANIGSLTVGLAKKVGRRGKVYAYEPQRSCHALLQGQIALNHLDQVIARPEACGAARGTMWHAPCDYNLPGNFGATALVNEAKPGFLPVTVETLDDAHRGEKVSLIKIDVEGMEHAVLSGARQLIREQQPIIYLENAFVESSKALISLVFEMGYRAWWHICPLSNANNYFGRKKDLYKSIYSINMVCMPASSPLDEHAFSGEVRLDAPHPLERPPA